MMTTFYAIFSRGAAPLALRPLRLAMCLAAYLWLLPLHLWAQQPPAIADLPVTSIGSYPHAFDDGRKVALLDMDFAQSEATAPWVVETVKDWEIDSIHLVYTAYPLGQDFSALNQQRIETLFRLLPELRVEDGISWRAFRQTDGKDLAEASGLFHGFAIYYQHEPPVTHQGPPDSLEIARREAFVSLKFDQAVAQKMGMETNDDGTTRRVFERLADQWDSVVVVADWTGSMYPYTFQVLKWSALANQREKIMAYVFFNDGDLLKTSEKVIGSTGGIYATTDTRVYAVLDTMAAVRDRGDGGELDENDFEALLFAIDRFPEAREFVLIADNSSEVRDTLLMPLIDRPVRILLSRTEKRGRPLEIQPPYARLAIQTGGSLHTADHDYHTPEAILQFVEAQKERAEQSKRREAIPGFFEH